MNIRDRTSYHIFIWKWQGKIFIERIDNWALSATFQMANHIQWTMLYSKARRSEREKWWWTSACYVHLFVSQIVFYDFVGSIKTISLNICSWTAASDPLSWPDEWSSKLLLNVLENVEHPEVHLNELLVNVFSIYTLKWKKKSLKLIWFYFRVASERGFTQFGSLFGQVTIGDDDSKEIHEMNLPGVRINRNSELKCNTAETKTWHLVAACKDGCVLSLLGRDIGNENKWVIGRLTV